MNVSRRNWLRVHCGPRSILWEQLTYMTDWSRKTEDGATLNLL
jgi:hypothetical protein